MVNIKFLSIIWKLTNILSVTADERGKSASHVFCIWITMLLVLAAVTPPFRYDEGSQTHTELENTKMGNLSVNWN